MALIIDMGSCNWCGRTKRCPIGLSRPHVYYSLPPLSISNPTSSCLSEAIISYTQRIQSAIISCISMRYLLCSLARVCSLHRSGSLNLHSLELSEQETQIPPVRLGSGTGGMGTISFYSYDGLMLRQTESYDLISAKLY